MPSGKMAAQAGHAFLEAYLASHHASRDAYRKDSVGTKVTLQGSYPQIMKLERKLSQRANIPFRLIYDSGHVLPPHFTGAPIVTALGVGLHPDSEDLIKNFHVWRIVS